MTTPRTAPYLYVTWISRYLTGDKSCFWACWFKGNFQGYEKMPSDFDSARWNMEHTDLLNPNPPKSRGISDGAWVKDAARWRCGYDASGGAF